MSLLLLALKLQDVALVCSLSHVVIAMAIVDYNGHASANESPDYICKREGIDVVDSIRQTCDCVFMNVKKLGSPFRLVALIFERLILVGLCQLRPMFECSTHQGDWS